MRAYRLCDAFSRSSRPPTRLRLYLVTAAFFTAFCAHRAASRAGEPKPAAPQESTRTVAVSAPTRSWRGNGGAPPQEWIERLIHSRNSGRASSEMPGARFRNFAPRDRRFLNDEQTHARSNGFFFLLAGTAFVVMFMTIESMGSRWLNDVRTWKQGQAVGGLPVMPVLPPSSETIRPLRVDAGQPQTRLAIDLAVFERARAKAQGRGADTTSKPKAA